MYTVTFLPSEISVQIPEGTTLMEAQIQAGLQPDAPCGGQGKCGKCLVDILEGSVTGVHKACTTTVTGNMVINTAVSPSEHKLLTRGTIREVPFAPSLTVVPISLPPILLGENGSDWLRLKKALKAQLPGQTASFSPDLELIGRLSAFCEAGSEGYAVLGNGKILDLTKEQPCCYMVAFDIGTTSIVGYLLDGTTGEELASESLLNPQSQYGADVIMRSNYALEHSVETLSTCVREALATIISKLSQKADCSSSDIYQISIVGNTCMSHLFLGLSPSSLVHAPYHPVLSEALTLDAEGFELSIHPKGQLLVLPNIAGFVGADTVGCLLASDFDHRDKMTLLIDIGTNGEMVLGNKERMICCSTAAGPAFEGAKITCGMRGAEGAIDHISFQGEELTYTVIGGGEPTGICGSGLLDLVSGLLCHGFLEDSGRLYSPEELDNPVALHNKWRIQTIDNMPAFYLTDPKAQTPVYLTQKDIREVQLAKAAIAAGIALMTEHLGKDLSQVEEVLIAGAFGSYMDAGSACSIGLIPYELKDRITSVGNAAGEGAKLVLQNQEEWIHARTLAAHTEFLELATSPQFQDCFVDELEFTTYES